MKSIKSILIPVLAVLITLSFYSCKTKKIAAKPAPMERVKQEPAPVKEEAPVKQEPVQEKPAEEAKPNFSFSGVHFEFNSAVLKTDSFSLLDQTAAEMKKSPDAKFVINGHSSAEGSVEHNMSLSVDRANAVKSYLVNAGLNAANFTIKGFGASQPATSNDTETGRALNRRVEIKPAQ